MKNVPKLRFNGFSDEWEERSLGELFDFKNGLNKEKEFFGKGTPIVNYVDVYRKNELTSDNILGLVEVTEKEKENYSVKKGDVFFTRTSETIDEIGYTAVVTEEVENTVFSGFVLRARPKTDNLSDIFCKYCFSTESARKEIVTKSSYTTRALTSGTLLSGMNVFLPKNIIEQEKIANFLTKVDKLIEKQDEKVSNLEQYKKGMMQKIFSQEIRFKKDDGGEYPEWTVKKLCEVANKFDYGMNSAAIEFDGENKYIRITDIDEKSNKYKKDNLVSPDGDLDDKYLVEENDILFARTGASVGKTYLYDKNDGKVYFAGFLIRVNVNKENNAKFIFMQTQTEEYRKWIEIMSMRSGQPGVNSQEYSTFQVKAPCLEEQDKIANFLSKIDSIVEKEKEKLEELRVWKRGLLQQMFI